MKKNPITLEELKNLHQNGQLDAAKEGYLSLLKQDPNNTEILHLLAILSAQQENFLDGIEYLNTALKIQPEDPNIQLHLANMLKAQGLFHEAENTLLKLLKQKPDYVAALNNLGTVNYALGKLDEAAQYFQRAIKKQPDFIDAYYNLGLAFIKMKAFDKAIKTFESLLILAPRHAPGRFQMACAFMQQNKLEEAIQQFLKIIESHPHHMETQSNLATAYLQQNNFDKAKEHYLQALELAPQDTQILFNLGVILTQQGNIDSAIQYYQRAIKINPNFFDAHNNLGVAFLMKQHIPFALHHFTEALRIQPNNVAIDHTVQMLSGDKRLVTSPPDYLRSLFDAYADHYESHLLTALEYKVPELLFKAVMQVIEPEPHSLNILDLGCGTGLCSVPFKPYAKKLIGVDLAEKMLAVAQQKNIFDELSTAANENFLLKHPAEFDLIIAGDVLVYTGDLASLFSALKNALRPNGLFAFNTEMTEKNDFVINQSGRFSHHKDYLDSLAKAHGLDVVFYETAITRMQNNAPVYGHLYVLRLM